MTTQVCSEVTGSVWLVRVAVGQPVEAGDELVVVESMKMEIPVAAPRAGRVREIRVSDGQPVREGEVVVVLE